jgi:hypothetical protein
LWGGSGLENGPAAAHIAQMNNPRKEDIDRQGGWLFQLKTPPNLTRLFYVYELNEETARALLRNFPPLVMTRRSR